MEESSMNSQPIPEKTRSLLDTARAYWEAGLTPMPRVPGDANPHFITTAGDIRPIGWGSYKAKQPSWPTVERWFRLGSLATVGITVLTGVPASPRPEDAVYPQILDIETADTFDAWKEELHYSGHSDILYRCILERTASGAAHVGFSCRTISDKHKLVLATRAADKKGLIELLQHQPCTIAPTQIRCKPEHPEGASYTLLQGSWDHPLELSPAQRQVLIDTARLFNEVPERVAREPQDQATTGDRPGDRLNQAADAAWWIDLLTRHGWRDVSRAGLARQGVYSFQRPGKVGRAGSATYGKTGACFYVFSSNAHPFEPEHGYKPFSAYALLEHGGDFTAAARALAPRERASRSSLQQARPRPSIFHQAIRQEVTVWQR